MIFNEYIKSENFKAEQSIQPILLETGAKNESIEMLIDSAQENTLTGRIVNGIIYCIYHKKFINLTELANQIRALYIGKGYMGYGFSKLQPKDFLYYSTSKVILKKLFDNELYLTEIDPKSAAKYFYTEDFLIS